MARSKTAREPPMPLVLTPWHHAGGKHHPTEITQPKRCFIVREDWAPDAATTATLKLALDHVHGQEPRLFTASQQDRKHPAYATIPTIESVDIAVLYLSEDDRLGTHDCIARPVDVTLTLADTPARHARHVTLTGAVAIVPGGDRKTLRLAASRWARQDVEHVVRALNGLPSTTPGDWAGPRIRARIDAVMPFAAAERRRRSEAAPEPAKKTR